MLSGWWVLLLCVVVAFALGFGGVFAEAASAQPSSLLEQVREHRQGIAVWWVGHNGWLVKSGDLLFSTDLVLEDSDRLAPSPISVNELAGELDVSFVTHGHGDHFHRETSRALVENSDCIFVIPQSCLSIAREIGIPEARIRIAVPKEPFELNGLQVRPLRAIHGNENFAVYEKANLQDCGYLIETGGKSLLQPGDSVLLEDQLFVGHVDVLFFSPTVHNTHIDRSVILINALDPDYILPQHRDTYRQTPENRFWTHGYALEVKKLLSKSLQDRYYILEPGVRLKID